MGINHKVIILRLPLHFLLLSLSFLFSGAERLLAGETFLWPLDAPPALTSTFCEFRPGHFHAGVDMKTYGQLGLPCLAVMDGRVVRVKVSPSGYGRALYLQLDDGRTVVYAHLDGFATAVEELVRREQEDQSSYAVELFLEEDSALYFRRGEVVGYSGRSGVKHSHLHFEIRDSAQRPLNPLAEGVEVADRIPPTPVAMTITPMNGESTVEGDFQPRIYSRLYKRHDGVWGPRDPIGVTGRIGVSLDAFDKTDTAENLLAVYRLELLVDGEPRWLTSFDRFDFEQARQLELERDYRLYRRGKGLFHRLFQMPGDNLELTDGDGIIDMEAFGRDTIDVSILLSDRTGNSSRVEFILVSDLEPADNRLVGGEPLVSFDGWGSRGQSRITFDIFDNYCRFGGPPGIEGFRLKSELDVTLAARPVEGGVAAVWLPPAGFGGRLAVTALDHNGLEVDYREIELYSVLPNHGAVVRSNDGLFGTEIPPQAVYDTLWVWMEPEPAYDVPGWIESVCSVEPRDQPLAGAVKIKLSRTGVEDDTLGWGLYYLDKRHGWTFLDNKREGDYWTGPALSWELFGLVRDLDTPTVIIRSPVEGETLRTTRPVFEAFVIDSTSGLVADGLTMILDEKRLPAEYDPPRDRLVFQPWHELTIGPHLLEIEAVDRVGNQTRQAVEFVVKP